MSAFLIYCKATKAKIHETSNTAFEHKLIKR